MVTALRSLSPRMASLGLAWLGGVTVAAAFAWWGAMFPTVVANTGLTFAEAVPCVASNSQLCELETALCGKAHVFGISYYSPTLFWCGVGLLSASLLAASLLPQPRR